MSTRCLIGKRVKDKVKFVFCKWGGMPKETGNTLLRSYSKVKQLNQLLSYGDLIELGDKIGEKHSWKVLSVTDCTFYIRDADCTATKHFLVKDWGYPGYWNWFGENTDYNYLLDKGKWYVKHWSWQKHRLLTEVLEEENESHKISS